MRPGLIALILLSTMADMNLSRKTIDVEGEFPEEMPPLKTWVCQRCFKSYDNRPTKCSCGHNHIKRSK
jgi:hypothetical protein